LLRALGTKNDARYNLKIVDTGDGSGRTQQTDNQAAATNDDTDAVPEAESDVVKNTRAELAELDDLDI
jgi:hypothetical protein